MRVANCSILIAEDTDPTRGVCLEKKNISTTMRVANCSILIAEDAESKTFVGLPPIFILRGFLKGSVAPRYIRRRKKSQMKTHQCVHVKNTHVAPCWKALVVSIFLLALIFLNESQKCSSVRGSRRRVTARQNNSAKRFAVLGWGDPRTSVTHKKRKRNNEKRRKRHPFRLPPEKRVTKRVYIC